MIDFDSLYEQYHDRVHIRVCTLLYYQSNLIDDAIQETWIKAWRALPGLKHEKNLHGWLKLIATRVVIDAIRKQKCAEHYTNSLEARAEFYEQYYGLYDNIMLPDILIEADPFTFVPERIAAQELRQETWDGTSEQDKTALLAHVNNQPVDIEQVYKARNNFKDRYHRAKERLERVSA